MLAVTETKPSVIFLILKHQASQHEMSLNTENPTIKYCVVKNVRKDEMYSINAKFIDVCMCKEATNVLISVPTKHTTSKSGIKLEFIQKY